MENLETVTVDDVTMNEAIKELEKLSEVQNMKLNAKKLLEIRTQIKKLQDEEKLLAALVVSQVKSLGSDVETKSSKYTNKKFADDEWEIALNHKATIKFKDDKTVLKSLKEKNLNQYVVESFDADLLKKRINSDDEFAEDFKDNYTLNISESVSVSSLVEE